MSLARRVLALVAVATAASAAPSPADLALADSLAREYRPTATVMVRHVARATLAQLDYAAYHGNNLLRQGKAEPLAAPTPRPSLATLRFGDALVDGSARDRLDQTPLTAAERDRPYAVEPLLEHLANWDYDRAEPLLLAAAAVEGEKWGHPELALPTQRLTTAWLHEADGALELWCEVDFEPSVDFLAGVSDEDGDGCPEVYAKLAAKVDAKLAGRLREEYGGRVLIPDEVAKHLQELVGTWYPRYRTVLLKPDEMRPWPNADTEPAARQELGGRQFAAATAVIRAQPADGVVLYNVFVIDGVELVGPEPAAAYYPTAPQPWGQVWLVSSGGSQSSANVSRWRRELQSWGGGSWAGWEKKVEPVRADLRRQLAARPKELKGLIGRDGFLFFRGSLDYVVAGDLRKQSSSRDPYPAIVDYQKQLKAKGIDLLVVILPAKPEIYPDKASAQGSSGATPYLQPYVRKLQLELAGAGVECVDLLPAFVAARAKSNEPFYLTQDTHWSNTAVRVAADQIGDRIRAYPWYRQVCPRPIRYGTRNASFTRLGDIRAMLTAQERAAYRPMQLEAQQVLKPDGSFYADDPNSPIVMLGDSFCGVYHFEDCEHAGLSAHVARQIGMPLDLIMAHGSGPTIRNQLARRGSAAVAKKKLVIWTVVARDLYNYFAPWAKVKVP